MLQLNKNPSDSIIISKIRSGGLERRLHENELYRKYLYFVKDAQFKHKISADDAASAYSDAILAVIDSLLLSKFEERSELKTYLFQIFSNKCVDFIRKNTTNKASVHTGVSLDDFPIAIPDETKNIIQRLSTKSDVEKLYQKLKFMGEKCKNIILAWGDGYDDQEIAGMMQYNTAAVAKTSRLRCLEKLKELYDR